MIRHYAWSAARQWGQRLGTALTFVILARMLSAEQIGLFSAALAIMALAELVNENGAGDAVIRHRDATPGAIKALGRVNVAASILLSTGFVLLGGRIEAWFGTPGLRPIVSALSLVLLLNAFVYIPAAVLRRDMAFARLARMSLSSTVLGSLVGIAGAFAGLGVWALVAQALTFAGSTAVQMNLDGGTRSTEPADFRAARPLFAFGGFVMLGNLLSYVSTRAIELALPYHDGAAVLALYVIGSRFYFVAAQMVTAVLLDVTMSRLSALCDDRAAFGEALASATATGAMVGGAIFFGLAAIAPEFCRLVFGHTGAAASPFLAVVAVAGNILLLNYVAQVALKALGHSRTIALTSGAQAALALLVLVPAWPIPALARVALVNALVVPTLAAHLLILRRVRVVSPAKWARGIAPVWAGGALMLLVVAGVRARFTVDLPDALALPILIGGGAAAYLIVVMIAAGRGWRPFAPRHVAKPA